ncbi:MAG TPA: STAS domain-containing protein, partial [Myxococcota bacterium]|nr:STAS domain-containing protein [Myxococcota bacterium]
MSTLTANLTRAEAAEAAAQLEAALQAEPAVLDLSRVTAVDSAGAALLADFARRARKAGRTVEVRGVHPTVARTLRLFPFMEVPEPAATKRPRLVDRTGEAAAAAAGLIMQYVLLCADVAWFTVASARGRRSLRLQATLNEMAATGSQALGVVGLIAFLVGG